ncbi:hypothetical protein LCGC14_1365340 [marine sediment metagenome]|uniref:HNH nuclease domain-containing protein n=1 Tax=marine sediment metagenome TaxID=412755 RepID=A0A0F9K6Z0_9ZZZZ
MTEKEIVLIAIENCYITKRKGVLLYNYIKFGKQYMCEVCGYKMGKHATKTIDHKIPLSLGGSKDFDNLQLAHRGCNMKKGNLIFSHELKEG